MAIYRPHPDGTEMTAFKIRKLFKKGIGKFSKDDKIELDKILREYYEQIRVSSVKEILRLKEVEKKFNTLKNILK